ncbi:MAG: serine/threonine protein kinase [Myxococcales bacterium]|nr:MAG: serine/threonine protein kinase [Myxococcales bacterium]
MAAKLFDPGVGRQRVDRYELMGEIASGGMATVYLARLTGMGGFQRFVAMKRLHPHLASEKEFVEMFLDEARIAARIHHPNVVPILEVGASQVGYYLVMEYIEGDTLARLLARAATTTRKLPVSIALRIAIDTLSGLHAAHELHDDHNQPVNLVHRDVSPQNVLVGQDGIARITDFGVARAASRLTATRVGQLKGKIAYMAPEQAAGSEELDRRADVFSAGIVVWESLAHKRLFKAENEAATLSRVIAEPVPLLHQIAPQVSKEVSAVVMRALDRDRDKRFASCAAFADALEAAAEAKDKVASPRELAAYVNEVLGPEIAQQRDNVRAWLAHSEPTSTAPGELPSGVIPSSSVSAAAISIPGSVDVSRSGVTGSLGAVQPPQRSRLPLVLGALLLIGLLGTGGFMLTRSARSLGGGPVPAATGAPEAAPAPAPVAPSSAAEPVVPPAVAPPTPPSALGAVPAAPVAAPPKSQTAPSQPARQKKKKPADDVDLRNPYR